ncbi:hypothetical protein F5984_09750 [Rudanella paleaurantiibacter]|uniref:Uncharacterized protein n=1 Tax=Rudanella paleaurantiibacter TaxID=2614655 RepID=A0A7J5U019_9BACT|nr:hypothetical protein [Rudanella paleaurantiibacter]KAB7731088.1 hypothetical protein F5984_09750 [Rudanella paleaurantiibacter]
MIQDGLYLNDQWVSPFENFALTFQGNDLTKPESQQTSYSSAIKLPDTVNVRAVTQSAEQPNSGSEMPYQLTPAHVVSNGEIMLRGNFRFTDFQQGWNGTLSEAKQQLLTRLKRPLRSLHLSDYDFPWSLDYINSRATAKQGVCFPFVDYGTLSSTEQPSDTLNPAVYVHSLVASMLHEEGYKLTGSLPADELYKRLALPFVEDKPTNVDPDFVEARRARVTCPTGIVAPPRSAGKSITLPFSVVDQPLEGFGQGRLNLYDPVSFSYVVDTAMRVKVTCFQQFQIKIDFGAVEAKLQLEKNGKVVAEEYWSEAGPFNNLLLRVQTIELKTSVSCQAGDRLRLRLVLQRRTRVAQWEGIIFFGAMQSIAGYEPDNALTFGDLWPVGRNLPDMDCLDLLKAVALLTCSTITVDDSRKQVQFTRISEVISNTADALDWTDRICVTPNEPAEITPALEPYGATNYLRWKECEGVDKGYGDGMIEAKSPAVDSVDLFTLPFAASMESPVEISGYGKPLRIETRTVTGSGENRAVNLKSTQPRLIIVEPAHNYTINTSILTDTGTIEKKPVTLMACWFDRRPQLAVTLLNNLSLNFADTATSNGLISRYFVGLRRVLRRPREVSISAKLTPADVAQLDFSRPVLLRSTKIDGLDFTQCYYYLNKVERYRADGLCRLSLVSFF